LKKSNNKIWKHLPPALDVGWAKFSFILKKNLKDEEDSKCYGITDFNKLTITLEENMSESEAHHTIIHECCHAFMETFGLGGPEEGHPDKVESSNEVVTESACRCFLLFRNLNYPLWKVLFEDYYE